MHISHDQAWIMEQITRKFGYNKGFTVCTSSDSDVVISYVILTENDGEESHIVTLDHAGKPLSFTTVARERPVQIQNHNPVEFYKRVGINV